MCTPMNENWSNFLNKLSERLNKMLDYVEKNNSTLYETDIDSLNMSYSPPKEMTIEEIEKELGYKVKLVKEEKE